jgi:hypothetical protein
MNHRQQKGRREKKIERATDRSRLLSISDAEVHAAIESDPDARPTDEEFWKDATVVMPSAPLGKKTI